MDAISIFLHLDTYLEVVIQHFGIGTYILLFLLVFAETGFVVTPFLPGDSLLFAAGALAAIGLLDMKLLAGVLILAAISGDGANYAVGKFFGKKIIEKKQIIKDEYLTKTSNFYAAYGAITIVIARFVPLIRTFAPFIAGAGKMQYRKFILYNVIGALLWVLSLSGMGYFFGNLPVVKQNFSFVVFGIVGISIIPVMIGLIREKSIALAGRRRE